MATIEERFAKALAKMDYDGDELAYEIETEVEFEGSSFKIFHDEYGVYEVTVRRVAD
jgi:hypothetical protein